MKYKSQILLQPNLSIESLYKKEITCPSNLVSETKSFLDHVPCSSKSELRLGAWIGAFDNDTSKDPTFILKTSTTWNQSSGTNIPCPLSSHIFMQ